MSKGSEHEAIVSAPTMVDAAAGELDLSRSTILAGRYEIQALLGIGGMGAVYRARDRELDELVALKMLRRALVDAPGMLARFKQEVKLARRVTHRNVARTFDIGEHDGAKFLTMELVDGESLSARLAREHAMPLVHVVRIGTELCAGLAAAHAAGIVHRDLKPDNVLLAKGGRVVITDFGIARAFSDGAAKTMGQPIGTPAYMAPEQVEGGKELDARADIYALGAMLYELLTGERAWQGESVYQVAAMRLVAPPPDPRDRRRDVGEPIASVVVKCMARKREDRFASADDLAAALSAIAPAPAVSSPPSISARANGTAITPSSALSKSVAVLPLRNAGPADDEYLADGLTDDVIDTLSMVRTLRVRSRGAVMRYKGQERDPREIGRELDVQVVADGSIRRAGDRVRVTVRLVSVDDGFQLWAKRFERPVAEVLSIADEAAGAIADALTVTCAAPAREVPTDPEAIELYLRARHESAKGWRDSNNRAIALYEAALERAPNDAQILAGFAMAMCRRFSFDETAEDAAERAVALAGRALEIAPHNASAHAALANVKLAFGEAVGAAHELRRALEIAPRNVDALEYSGRILAECGRIEEGIPRLMAAISAEPERMVLKYEIARLRALLGEWDETEAILGVLPEGAHANPYWLTRWRLVMWRRDAKQAARLEELVRTSEFGLKHAAVAMLSMIARGTFVPEALVELDARGATGRAMRRRSFFRQIKAEVLAYAGDDDGMLVALEESAAARLLDLAWLDRCPLFDGKRDLPRFRAVRDKVGAYAESVLAALTTPTR